MKEKFEYCLWKKHFLIRVFWLFIIPILIYALYLSPPWETSDFYRYEKGDVTYATTEASLNTPSNPPSIKEHILNVFKVPFGLTWKYACFVDEGSHIDYGSSSDTDFSWNLILNNGTSYPVKHSEEVCIPVNPNIPFTYDWQMQAYLKPELIDMNLGIGSVTIKPRTSTYSKVELTSWFITLIIFLIAWLSLFWLSTRIKTLLFPTDSNHRS